MRHLLANIATYTIALLLLAGAGVFAWMRSAQVVFTTESAVLAQYEPAMAGEFRWRELGPASYRRNCANCHGSAGEGWDQYPSLSRTAAIFEREGGRNYLIDLHLYGLASPRWRAPMPPMPHLQDAELAAVINHVLTGLSDPGVADESLLVDPADVAGRRGQRLSPGEVNRRRPTPP